MSATVPLPLARAHLEAISDGTGIIQFAHGSRPLLGSGYCTDDVARALRLDLRHAALTVDPAVRAAVDRDLGFLESAFDPLSGRFRNVRAMDGAWLDGPGSEDAHGRAVQALGEAVVRAGDPDVRARASTLFLEALPRAAELSWARPQAYATLGCVAALGGSGALVARPARAALAVLVGRLHAAVIRSWTADDAWPWPEPACTYDNGVLAEALIVGGRALDQPRAICAGMVLLEWLLARETTADGWLRPIGNRGWLPHGGEPAEWDQQPIEPASLVAAEVAAWDVTRADRWAEAAERALGWFLGDNDLGVALADPDRGACRDGLGPAGANINEGAESTLCWLLSVERIRELRQGRSATRRTSGVGHARTYASTSARLAVASATLESAAP